MANGNIWWNERDIQPKKTHGERETNLKNAREAVEEYKREYRRKGRKMKKEQKEMLGRFMAKLLYGWDNGKFDQEYLKKLERNWKRWKGTKFFWRKNLKRGGNIINQPSSKVIWLKRWEGQKLFCDRLDKRC